MPKLFDHDPEPEEQARLDEVCKVEKLLARYRDRATTRQMYLVEGVVAPEKKLTKRAARMAVRRARNCGIGEDEIPASVLEIADFA